MSKKPVIAIDGTSASGKGSLARKLAEKLGFSYLDTGKLYRYVGHRVLEKGGDPGDPAAAGAEAALLSSTLRPEFLQDEALQGDEAGKAASMVGVFPEVRAALLDYQRGFAANPPDGAAGAVLDGRDIGTVICPDAVLKLYIDAAVEIRANRRFKELQSKGFSVTYDAVLADMRERDRRDASREAAPMKPADDAIVIDTSAMSLEDVLDTALSLAGERLEKR